MTCEICTRVTHEWYDCPKRPDGYAPLARRGGRKESMQAALDPTIGRAEKIETRSRPSLHRTKSAATRKSALNVEGHSAVDALGARSEIPPVDGPQGEGNARPPAVLKRPRGRPASISDMKAYKAGKAREYRARDKAKPNG